MWDNTILNEEYIANVCALFEDNSELGLMLLMLNIGNIYMMAFQSAEEGWKNNYENIQNLIKELEIKCDLNKDFPPISYGTIGI